MSAKGGDFLLHRPLPYIVTVSIATNEDDIPEQREVRLTAYSVIEAMMQAPMEIGGGRYDDPKYKVVSIRPDLAAWQLMDLAK